MRRSSTTERRRATWSRAGEAPGPSGNVGVQADYNEGPRLVSRPLPRDSQAALEERLPPSPPTWPEALPSRALCRWRRSEWRSAVWVWPEAGPHMSSTVALRHDDVPSRRRWFTSYHLVISEHARSEHESALQSVLAARQELTALGDGDGLAFERLHRALDAAAQALYRLTETSDLRQPAPSDRADLPR